VYHDLKKNTLEVEVTMQDFFKWVLRGDRPSASRSVHFTPDTKRLLSFVDLWRNVDRQALVKRKVPSLAVKSRNTALHRLTSRFNDWAAVNHLCLATN
jgi:hypothetical protein